MFASTYISLQVLYLLKHNTSELWVWMTYTETLGCSFAYYNVHICTEYCQMQQFWVRTADDLYENWIKYIPNTSL